MRCRYQSVNLPSAYVGNHDHRQLRVYLPFLLHNSSFEYTNNFYKKNNTKKKNGYFFNRLVGFR